MICPHENCKAYIDPKLIGKDGGFCPSCKQIVLPVENESYDVEEEFIVSEGKVDFSKIRQVLTEQHQHLRLFGMVDKTLGFRWRKILSNEKMVNLLL
jgi:hypothetical protein